MSQDDFDKWEARYATHTGPAGEPDPFFVTVADRFLPSTGAAVDLAGGGGRHALWLAARGLDTTLVDIAPAGLSLATRRAETVGLSLNTMEHDLDNGPPAGTWDVGLVSYFLIRDLLPTIHRLLNPGGILTLVHPTVRNLQRHPRPGHRWLFNDGELNAIEGLKTLHLEEGWSEQGRHEVRYVGLRS